jgi:hypothetical protein
MGAYAILDDIKTLAPFSIGKIEPPARTDANAA